MPAQAGHEDAPHPLHQQTGDTHGKAGAWNNLGTAYRGLERFEEAVATGERAVETLAAAEDWFRTGQAWGELATTLTAAHADPQQVTDAWNHSATAYTQAGADKEATASRTNATGTDTDTPEP
ncbi:hypothetical protein [Streptomyces sp. NPDC005525]|uniref:hypothetical protein n=1 Tax=Streptomyces sp. NPDC005525 TaxID=3364720 RepID=UPI00368CD0C2